MKRIKNTVTGHISCSTSKISKEKLKEVLQSVAEHYYELANQNISLNGHEQIVYIKEYNNFELQGNSIGGCIINFTQENAGSFYQITGLNECPKLIGAALEKYYS